MAVLTDDQIADRLRQLADAIEGDGESMRRVDAANDLHSMADEFDPIPTPKVSNITRIDTLTAAQRRLYEATAAMVGGNLLRPQFGDQGRPRKN